MNIKRYGTWHWIPTERIKGEMGRYQLPWQGNVRQSPGFAICKENFNSGVCNEGGYFSSLGSVSRIYYLSVLLSLNADLNFHCNVLYACIAVYLCRISSLLSEVHRSSYSLWNHLYISRSFDSSVFWWFTYPVSCFDVFNPQSCENVLNVFQQWKWLKYIQSRLFLNCIWPAFCF